VQEKKRERKKKEEGSERRERREKEKERKEKRERMEGSWKEGVEQKKGTCVQDDEDRSYHSDRPSPSSVHPHPTHPMERSSCSLERSL